MPLTRARRKSKKRSQLPPATQEASQPPPTHPNDPSSQSVTSGSQASRGWRWTDEQTLYFLGRLLEARRNGDLNINKKGAYQDVLVSFIPGFKTKWANQNWSYDIMKNKLRNLKDFWRAFREAYDLSGGGYRERTGCVDLSRDNREKIEERYPQHGHKAMTEGLLVGPYITMDSWEEIFADDLPAGRLITAADDDIIWVS